MSLVIAYVDTAENPNRQLTYVLQLYHHGGAVNKLFLASPTETYSIVGGCATSAGGGVQDGRLPLPVGWHYKVFK